MLGRILLTIDNFGEQPSFYLNSEKKNKSYFTGMLTLITLILSGLGLIFFGQEMWERKNPVVNMQTTIDYHPPILPYFSDFQFNINLKETNTGMLKSFIDDRIYTSSMQIYTNTPKGLIHREINLENCTDSSFDPENLALFKENGSIENHLCVSKNQTFPIEDIKLGDTWGGPNFNMMIFQFQVCKNTTENKNKCKPQSEIDYWLGFHYVGVNAINSVTDTKNYVNPIKKLTTGYFSIASHNTYTELNLSLKSLEFLSDVGLMFEETDIKKGYKHEDFVVQRDFKTRNDVFVYMSIQMTPTKDIYNRSYLKFQGLFAQVGGLVKFFTLICNLLTFYFDKMTYYEKVMNQIFNFEEKDFIENKIVKTEMNKIEMTAAKNFISNNCKIKYYSYKTL
jgi:hypothetical protein